MLFFAYGSSSYCQSYKINFTVHSRVDTTNAEIKNVLSIWINYLESSPDSLYDNPWWNSGEKKKYKIYDFAGRSLYQFPAHQLLDYFQPIILSINKEDSNYVIRTLFYQEGLKDYYARSNPWAILRVYVINENNEWKIANALPYLTHEWHFKKIGKIEYVYPPAYNFNKKLAKDASEFCDSIAKVFNVKWQPFKYYITPTGDELGRILGFDFFFAGYATGRVFYEDKIMLSGFNSEWYPHEFVHLVLGSKENIFVSEGIATFIGGSMQKSFTENVTALAEAAAKNDTVTLEDVYDKKWGWQSNAFYTSGGIICEMIYKTRGIDGLKKYFNAPKERDAYFKFLSSLLNMNLDEINLSWRLYLKISK